MRQTIKTLLGCFLCTLFFARPALAQEKYGFEWIVPGQTYYKFTVAKTGAYRIPYAALQAAGFPVSTVNPKKIQLFHQGREIPVYIHGENDDVFDPADFIEFLGRKNNGYLDKELYRDSSMQLNPTVSIVSDTAAYFLSYIVQGSQIGLRYNSPSNPSFTGLQPEPYFIHRERKDLADIYNYGVPVLSEFNYHTSDYVEGEGWGSLRFGKGGGPTDMTVQLILEAIYTNAGPQPYANIIVSGASDFKDQIPDHHLALSLSTNQSSYTQIWDTIFEGYKTLKLRLPININSIGYATDFRFSTINDLNTAVDYHSLSSVELVYPRKFDMMNYNSALQSFVQSSFSQPYTFLEFINCPFSSPVLYDLSTGDRWKGTFGGTILRVALNKKNEGNEFYLFDSAQMNTVNLLQQVDMSIPDAAANYEYLIITHKTLLSKATDYASYRAQEYNVLLQTIDKLANVYSYGVMHPLSIRRFARHLLNNATLPPSYLLLIGRGLQHDLVRNPQNQWLNLLPQIGVPSSDNMFTSGLAGTRYEPAIPTGRLPAIVPQDVENYLDKIKEHESNPDSIQLWRKNLLHLGGGDGLSQTIPIQQNLNSIKAIAEDSSLGSRVTSYYKSSTAPQETNLKQKIVDAINGGLNILTFYGHGSLNILDIDIGTANDISNKGRYPLMYFNGCNVGNISADNTGGTAQIGVNAGSYIQGKQKGCLAWLAHSNNSLISFLSSQTTAFYTAAFQTHYGSSLGRLLQLAIRNSQDTLLELSKCHSAQIILYGDPGAHLYGPARVEYVLSNSDLFVSPANVSATSDSFAIAVIARNAGKATGDSLSIRVSRQLPDNSVVNYPVRKFKPLYNTDTVYYYIRSKDARTAGLNTFTVQLDPLNQVTEYNESNNTASFTYLMPGNAVNLVYPYPYAIVNKNQVKLLAQAQDLFTPSAEFRFEIDTSASFNGAPGPYHQVSGIIPSNGSLAEWNMTLPDDDSLVFYWRARLNIPVDQGGDWNQGSFRLVKKNMEGWSQGHFQQYSKSKLLDMELDTLNRRFHFRPTEMSIDVLAARWKHVGLGIKTETSQFLTAFANDCFPNGGGLILMLFDRNTLSYKLSNTYSYNCQSVIDYNLTDPEGLHYYTFDLNTPDGQLEFQQFVNGLEDSIYVALSTRYKTKSSGWTENTYRAFERLGAGVVRNVNNDSMAYVMIGVKGAPAGSALEDYVYNPYFASPTGRNDADTMLVGVNRALRGRWKAGTMESDWIGPSMEWKKMYCRFQSLEINSQDQREIDVFVRGKNGQDSLYFEAITTDSFDLSTLDAKNYPYMKMLVRLFDDPKRTPAQLRDWSVVYTPAPEGTINPALKYSFYNGVMEEGEQLKIDYAFQNLSDKNFDSLTVRYQLIDQNRILRFEQNEKHSPLSAYDTLFLSKSINTLGLEGQQLLLLSVNPDFAQPERSLLNNIINVPFRVNTDHVNPLLDVLFDGQRIMNGEIVSPTPLISITSKDENKFLMQDDSALYEVYLMRPGASAYEQIYFAGGEVTFIPASAGNNNEARILYKPARLADGFYRLKVLARDRKKNLSGLQPYEVGFVVVNESSISSFVPYPNPFTSSMRFVFTLTGNEIPDQLRIRIMTVSGKIIREISAAELGPMRIGNNVSQFAWDGTDQYGDRLAKGVYLYQVTARIKGQNVKHRSSSADKYFVQQTGKIYLLR